MQIEQKLYKISLFSVHKALQTRLSNRPDSEHVQAGIRILITSVFALYFFLVGKDQALEFVGIYLVIAILIFFWIVISPSANVPRRIIGIIGDMSTTTAAFYLAGEAGAPAVAIYLWVITGNGFRYGNHYLLFSALLATIGFVTTWVMHPYWSQHFWLGLTLFIVLTFIPLYMAILLKKLYQALRMAEEANQAKSKFLAHMSHELRTPLNGILGITELLSATAINAKQKEYTNLIQSSGRTLLCLIEDILDISKIEAGKLSVALKPFDLHRLVASCMDVFRNQADKKGISFTSHIDTHVPFRLIGDELHIRQVLLNFLSNAMKFTAKGRVELHVSLRNINHTGIELHFAVKDTGIGLAPEAQQRIFESFEQANTSVTREYGGTGLGTTISRDLITAMGGTIGLHSTLGEGSTFWFTLTLQPQATTEKSETAKISFQNARIITLLGDGLLEKVEVPLVRWGQHHCNTTNVLSLFSTLISPPDELPYNIVMIDEDALAMSPNQFMAEAVDAQKMQDISFIIISRSLDKTQHEQWQREGFASVLTQPVNESLLFNALHEICYGIRRSHTIPSLMDVHKKKDALKGLNILVAEDNEVNQIVIREFLEGMGHHVVMVEDGEEALDALIQEGSTFNIAFLDINMPQMSGLDVLKAYRFLEVDTHLPMVMLSADALSTSITECMQAGADHYLTKPIEKIKIAQTIEQLVSSNATQYQSLAADHKQPKAVVQDDTASVINMAVLSKLSAISKKERFVQNLIETFINTSHQRLHQLQIASTQGDDSAFQNICHTLQGSAGTLGAVMVEQYCSLLSNAPSLTPQQMQDGLAQLNEVIVSAENILKSYAATLDHEK